MLRLVVAICAAIAMQPATAVEPLVGVASVIDGDTIEIHGQRIRLHGVDAPEGRQMCTRDGEVWRCGAASANALDEFIGGRTVTCSKTGMNFKRIVAKCTVGGADMNAWLVDQGWALDSPKYSKGEYADEQDGAKGARRGVWSGEFENPYEVRHRNKTKRAQ